MTPTPISVHAVVTGPTALYTAADGHRETVDHPGGDIRAAIVRRATDDARRAGIAIELHTSGDRGTHRLLIHTDGTLTPLPGGTPDAPEPEPPEPRHDDRESGDAGLPESETSDVPEPTEPNITEPGTRDRQDAGRAGGGSETPKRMPAAQPNTRDHAPRPDTERVSFIDPPATDATASSGVRGWLARLGIQVGPSMYEVARDGWVRSVSRQWAGCRTIAVVNGKGGVGKTMTAAMLAAVFARHGGGSVLALDNNDTRGTLGWRTETGPYDTTIRDLIPAIGSLLGPDAGVSEIARFVHHQPTDRYDVLRSNPELLATDQRLTRPQFDRLMQVAARYYRLVVFDSGNDESSDRWVRMVDHTQQLVIPTLATPESAESAALLLDALNAHDDATAKLAENAVVVVTSLEPGDAPFMRRIADGFAKRVRTVETIPFDPALKSGPLRFENLRAATADAWLRVAAAAAEGLPDEVTGRE